MLHVIECPGLHSQTPNRFAMVSRIGISSFLPSFPKTLTISGWKDWPAGRKIRRPAVVRDSRAARPGSVDCSGLRPR